MDTLTDYRVAALAVRDGRGRPGGLTDAQWSALLLAESPEPEWRAARGQRGFTEVRRELCDAWSWEVADAYRGPARRIGAAKTLFKPNGHCGYCGRRLSGEKLTFCNRECRTRYIRRETRGGARVCRTDGCGTALGAEYQYAYCPDCQDARWKAEVDAEEARWERPCKTDGCDNVAAWSGTGRPPEFCTDCGDPKRLARERKRRERERKRAASGTAVG